MKHSHGSHAMKGMGRAGKGGQAGHEMGKELVKGAVASATVQSGGKLMSKLVKYPVVVFGLGIAAGYVAYRYRKEIISGVSKATDASKDFVLNQKENLEDLVAETKEDKS